LKKSVSRRSHAEEPAQEKAKKKPRGVRVKRSRRWPDEVRVSDYPEAGHYGKGPGIKETQNTLVFQVAPKATKTEIKEAVQSILK